MIRIFKVIGERCGIALGQESTWRGIIGILTAIGVSISPELAGSIIAVGMAAIGTINIAKKD